MLRSEAGAARRTGRLRQAAGEAGVEARPLLCRPRREQCGQVQVSHDDQGDHVDVDAQHQVNAGAVSGGEGGRRVQSLLGRPRQVRGVVERVRQDAVVPGHDRLCDMRQPVLAQLQHIVAEERGRPAAVVHRLHHQIVQRSLSGRH